MFEITGLVMLCLGAISWITRIVFNDYEYRIALAYELCNICALIIFGISYGKSVHDRYPEFESLNPYMYGLLAFIFIMTILSDRPGWAALYAALTVNTKIGEAV